MVEDNYLIVIPYTNREYLDECLETLKLPKKNLLLVDNSVDNKGVAGSWNLGIKEMKKRSCDWLIIMSAAMRFGPSGGSDMLYHLRHADADIVRFAERTIDERPFDGDNKVANPAYPMAFYWHCTAISKGVVERVGKFDANFYPIYFEDIDYDLRIKKAGPFKDLIIPIEAESIGAGHGVKLGKVKSDPMTLIAYFATKWGSHPSAAKLGTYEAPFDDNNNSVAFWPPAKGEVCDE